MSDEKDLTLEELGIGGKKVAAGGETDITFVLDRSGSMGSIRDDTIGGFNIFLEDQKKTPGNVLISLHQFDDQHETIYDAMDLKDINPLDGTTFVPRGSTALLDAIGQALNLTRARTEKSKPDQVLFVIITDGGENASHEFKRESIFEQIKKAEDDWDWQIIFLAANQDAISEGASLGISGAKSMTYGATGMGTREAFSALSENTIGYRISGKAKTEEFFTEDQREKQDV